jgi:hypothetical protein
MTMCGKEWRVAVTFVSVVLAFLSFWNHRIDFVLASLVARFASFPHG